MEYHWPHLAIIIRLEIVDRVNLIQKNAAHRNMVHVTYAKVIANHQFSFVRKVAVVVASVAAKVLVKDPVS
jgi:hypothetical protein